MEPKSKGFYSPTEAAIPRGDSPEGWLPRWDCKIPNFEAPCLYCHYHLLPRPLGVVDHYGSCKGVHPFTGSLTTFNVTGCLVYLFGEAMIMVFVARISVGIHWNSRLLIRRNR